MDKYRMYADTVRNRVCCPDLQIETSVVKKKGHVYLEWMKSKDILFTKSELLTLHRGFSHPTTDKLLDLLKRARPWETDAGTKEVLEQISKACDACQRLGPTPLRFKTSLPNEEDLIFGDKVSIDLMWVDGKAVLHVVDTATRFSAATFLDANVMDYGHSVEGIWLAFFEIWCTMYTAYPNHLRADQGSVFTSNRWKNVTDLAGIQLRLSGVKAHSSFRIGERLHHPLRRIFEKIRMDYSHTPRNTLLKIAVKVMNDTIGENGLVPSRLVFGIIPRFPIISTDLPSQKERMEILVRAQMEMNAIVAERRIMAPLTKDIPPAADRVCELGEEVLVFAEKEKKWTGPSIVVNVHGRMITVQARDGSRRQIYNAFQVKPYFRERNPADILYQNLMKFRSKEGKMKRPIDVHITEIIKPGDPRAWKFDEAKKKEIKGLMERGNWKAVYKNEVPDDANLLEGMFVLAIKDEGTNQEVSKARFVVQGYRDKMKTSVVHDTATARQHSTQVLVGLAALFGFRLFSTDVTQAYLQSAEQLMRDLYVIPSEEFELGPDQVLKLLNPLYGLADSGDYRGKTLKAHLQTELGMDSAVNDAALFFKTAGEELLGLCATYVDDALHAGDKEYSDMSKKTEKTFKCRPRERDNVQFAGVEIESKGEENKIHQKLYISKLIQLMANEDFAAFRSLRAQLAWVLQTRPDIACAVALLTQVTEARFHTDAKKYVTDVDTVVKHLQKTPYFVLRYPKLDKDSIRLQIYSDASYASNYDASSKLGYIIFLADKNNSCQPLLWSSHKSKRVSRSVLGCETMAFADAFDVAFAIRHDLERMIGNKVPISMFTDSLSLFDVMTKATIKTEESLMIDLTVVQECYNNSKLDQIGFIRSENNPADALTKITRNSTLEKMLDTAKLDHRVEQWTNPGENVQPLKDGECECLEDSVYRTV